MTAISIHAPREGSDPFFGIQLFRRGISIHAPREGSDRDLHCDRWRSCVFQSTLPARGATKLVIPFPLPGLFQSTLPARGATNRIG